MDEPGQETRKKNKERNSGVVQITEKERGTERKTKERERKLTISEHKKWAQ